MAKWKLIRESFGNEEFKFTEGQEVTIGRGVDNTVSLASIVVSRHHCVINVQKEKVIITDLKSSNGVYVGLKKIPPNTPHELQESDIIGIGWTEGAPIINIKDKEKYMFRITKENREPPITHRIRFQSDCELDNVKAEVAAIVNKKSSSDIKTPTSPLLQSKPQLKRKLDAPEDQPEIKIKKEEVKRNSRIVTIDDDIITLLSDSDIEANSKKQKSKTESICNELQIKEELIKMERDDLEYEAFNVKQEYLGYDDEAIQCDSDSDSESEHWLLRLSQSSPGKPFIKMSRENKIDLKLEDSSYSQMDDCIGNNIEDEEFENDLITILPQPLEDKQVPQEKSTIHQSGDTARVNDQTHEEDEELNDIISLDTSTTHNIPEQSKIPEEKSKDVVDGVGCDYISKEGDTITAAVLEKQNDRNKKIQMIDPLVQLPRKKNVTPLIIESKPKILSSKHGKNKKTKSSKIHITDSQKEERKKRLKEIATKEKEDNTNKNSTSSSKQDKPNLNVKVTASNRGAFLTDVVQGFVKPMTRKESPQKILKGKQTNVESSPGDNTKVKQRKSEDDIENNKKNSVKSKNKEQKRPKDKEKHSTSKSKSTHSKSQVSSTVPESRVPLKSLKPLAEGEECFSGKPFSKVEPFPPKKPKKSVRFSDAPPRVHVFEIEEGNKMKKTSLIKTTLVDVRQMPVFSLEKITLMKILRWNPHWLEEQMNNNDPPPILGHNNPPMTIFHSFSNHSQYVQLVGDLLLMEIWECLTQGYMRSRHQSNGMQMRIASLPPVPSQERCLELFNMSVDVSVPTVDARTIPRVGEVMLIAFGPENARNQRFFFVHNVRNLPSRPNNIHSFFTISLHTCFTEKMKSLRLGEVMIGLSLAYINKELMLFEAMEYLAGSPLSEAILRPEPRHFIKTDASSPMYNMNSQWTKTLNPSQQMAVTSSVAAALGDRPCIQMVQGPPGTGKSSVICAIVMSYFYDAQGRRQQNRGKILICATSNAAVDELVIRLLNIRQNLPKMERFRMVRVGRAEAMHPRAKDVSSQQLAQRDAQRLLAEPAHPGLADEISHLEARINMWKTQALDAKDPVRVAYCQSRVAQFANKIALLRSGGGGGSGGGGDQLRADQLAQAERRIIEGADIVVTTLASAHNFKMRGLKRRIALCIVDEAGQAIEPETLIPLTLDVTRLTLIGDPQQLPGFICSQRAKKHGLGESLFSRMTSCAEQWREPPAVLLDQQYRMHPHIADYPNRAFYAGVIRSIPQQRPELDVLPYCMLGISSGDKGQGTSGANEVEAWGVSRLVAALSATVRALNLSLAVITPYNAQKELIKKNLRALQDPSEPQVEVNTVDSFQGQERDVVVVSLARSQGVGFLTDAGRMNVMLTRARHALLVCLNPHAMIRHHQWQTLVEDAQRRHLYRVLPPKICQATTAAKAAEDDILKYIKYHMPNHQK